MSGLHGLILAGGRSTRMGRDKAALEYHGLPQAQHLAALLAPYCQTVHISVRDEQLSADFARGIEPITDHYQASSPLNGIVSAMRALPDADWLVVAVDMPAIDTSAIETLIRARDPACYATCFASPAKGGPDPLFAIWESHGFAGLESFLLTTEGHACPRNALKKFGARVTDDGIAPQILMNVNTPQEYAEQQKADA